MFTVRILHLDVDLLKNDPRRIRESRAVGTNSSYQGPLCITIAFYFALAQIDEYEREVPLETETSHEPAAARSAVAWTPSPTPAGGRPWRDPCALCRVP